MIRSLACVPLLLAGWSATAVAQAQPEQRLTMVNSPCNVVIQTTAPVSTFGVINICLITPNRPRDPSKISPLVIDRPWVFAEKTNFIRYEGDIVFKPGGEFQLPAGGRLEVHARSVRSWGQGRVRVVGTGAPGQPGRKGRDGNGGGFEPNCRPVTEKHDGDGRPHWDTDNADDWDAANVACDHNGSSCDRGLPGEPGGTGLPGPEVVFFLRAKPRGTWSWELSGGDPGAPGKGGLGMRHHLRGSDAPPAHECPSGADGSPGLRGKAGTCTLFVGKRQLVCPGTGTP